MKSDKDFVSDSKFALLLMGAPKSGKTTLCMNFPAPYFLDADDNLASAVRQFPGKKFWYDTIDKDDAGKPVPEAMRWTRFAYLLKKIPENPNIQTIIIDSLTKISIYLQDHIVKEGGPTKDLIVGGEKVMTQQMWWPYSQLLIRTIAALRNTGKYIIFTAHERPERDDKTGEVLRIIPSISGQLRDTIGAFFTDVWACESRERVSVQDKKSRRSTEYFVRTAPTSRKALGCSCQLPTEFEFSWPLVERYLKGVESSDSQQEDNNKTTNK